MTEKEILELIEQDSQMMSVLRIAEKQNLKDWLIGAGFVRNKVWNHLSGKGDERIDATDIDMVYFDPTINNDQEKDGLLMQTLNDETGLDWEIRNNAYNYKSDIRSEYTSSKDVIAGWPETVTAIGVKIENGKLVLVAPYGIDDLVNFIVRPSPKFKGGVEIIKERVSKKKWLEKWPKITLSF